jgi:sporulation protein YunB
MKIAHRHHTRKSLRFVLLLLFLIWIAVLSIWIQKKSEPSLCSMAKAQINQEFQAFLCTFLSEEKNTPDFLNIRYDQSGKIQSISADIQKVNQFKSALMHAFLEQESMRDAEFLKIPLGNLTNQPIFHGRGPSFQVKILPCQQVSFDLVDTFLSAGINQTLHQIDLVLTAKVEIILPGGILTETLSERIPLSKTLIVGDVPQLYPSGSIF